MSAEVARFLIRGTTWRANTYSFGPVTIRGRRRLDSTRAFMVRVFETGEMYRVMVADAETNEGVAERLTTLDDREAWKALAVSALDPMMRAEAR